MNNEFVVEAEGNQRISRIQVSVTKLAAWWLRQELKQRAKPLGTSR